MKQIEITCPENLKAAIKYVNRANKDANMTWSDWLEYLERSDSFLTLCQGGKTYLTYMAKHNSKDETIEVPDLDYTGDIVYIGDDE